MSRGLNLPKPVSIECRPYFSHSLNLSCRSNSFNLASGPIRANLESGGYVFAFYTLYRCGTVILKRYICCKKGALGRLYIHWVHKCIYRTCCIGAENFRMVDIEINAWSSLFLNLETNLILHLYPEKCIKFNQSESRVWSWQIWNCARHLILYTETGVIFKF